MSYISVRGNLGGTYSQVEGLSPREADRLQTLLRRGPKTEYHNEVSFFAPVINLINQLEFTFGYEVVSCTNTVTSGPRGEDVTMWTMFRPGYGDR